MELLDQPVRLKAPSDYIDAAQIGDAAADRDAPLYAAAPPGPHIVKQDLFDRALLVAVEREIAEHDGWRTIRDGRQNTRRSTDPHRYGPAIETYLAALNSARFVRYLTRLTGLPHLIADATVERAGPHESVAGSFMAVHRDFTRHRGTDLQNAVLVMTYLTRHWQPDYAGMLELCAADGTPVQQIPPLFGQTVILSHPDRVPHGCPQPFTAPDDIVRRSIATYFYINPDARTISRPSTRFVEPDAAGPVRSVARIFHPSRLRSMLAKRSAR